MTAQQVLVALDGSPAGSAALPYAVAVAASIGASLRLLSVVPKEPRGLTARSERVATELEARRQDELQRYLADTASALQVRGVECERAVVPGDPAETILAVAAEPRVAVVALSTHGRGGTDRWLVGSVADKALRLSPRPTLVVRAPYFPVRQRDVTLDRLLVPLDGSASAEAALPLAQRLATARTQILLVRVEPWRTEGVASLGSVPEFTELEEEIARTAEAYLARAVRQLEPHHVAQTLALRGRPAQSLVDFALHERVDLVVMTTRGRGGMRRWLLGSTADFLVRAGVPTLLVRPEPLEQAPA